ncbi:iron ABC transporter permease [Corticibacter populi]|uniref:Iron ABC transporter permease n=1 Tax=Corticibacter populi TaxID=1550736 RepID=A0A3M6QMZ1_9BURK|nr:iron ABC transporter permease [Corticibacter populi]RMX04335.1 iron ABC transporter permease [Corticibacter populi]
MALAMTSGKYPLTLGQLWQALVWPDRAAASEAAVAIVVWEVRLPRVLTGALVGAALAAAGATYQGMFRNPLVSPDILGVSAGAGLGAALGIFLGGSIVLVQLLAFGGGLLAVAAVLVLAMAVRRHDQVLVLVLAGMAVGTLLGAGISLLKILADPYTQLSAITFWLLGGLHAVTLADLRAAGPLMLVGLVPMVLLRWRVNLLSLSDDEAQALGVHVLRLRLLLVIAATLMTAAAVSITGIIGWVGLMVPHAARLLVGPEFGRLLPVALLLGAGFVVLADTLARSTAGIELPLGVVTALVGAPCFLWLLARSRWRA